MSHPNSLASGLRPAALPCLILQTEAYGGNGAGGGRTQWSVVHHNSDRSLDLNHQVIVLSDNVRQRIRCIERKPFGGAREAVFAFAGILERGPGRAFREKTLPLL